MGAVVDASLLRQEEGSEGESRFRMLETIRAFARERLAASGEEPATRDRHAGYFRDLAERARDAITDTADPALLDAIEREHDNLRAALAWSRDTGDHAAFLRLAGALAFFWYYRGHLGEGRRWLDQALGTPVDMDAPSPRAWALTTNGLLANVAGEPGRAVELLTASFAWWERSGDPSHHAFARSLLGGVHVGQCRYAAAAPLFAANRDYFRDGAHPIMLAHANFYLGVIAGAQGHAAG